MFLDNKYTKWYNAIIQHRILNPLPADYYTENHHVIPKSLGGSNSKKNLVALTAREHFVCHRLLVKMTEGSDKVKMSFAIRNLMIRKNQFQERIRVSSAVYASIIQQTKKEIGESLKGKNNPYYGKTHSEDAKKKMKEKRSRQPPPMLGKSHSDETKEKIRKKNKILSSDPTVLQLKIERSKKQFENPENRYKAGNGKRGKCWYVNPSTGESILCFPNECPANYVKGRKISK